MTNANMPLAEITHKAITILCREMGVINTTRFLNQYSTGHGNYTEERNEMFGKLTVDDIAAEIVKDREK